VRAPTCNPPRPAASLPPPGLSNVSGDVREDKVRFAFELFDLDGSGYIEEEELRRIVRATNLSSEKQLDRKVRWLMSQCDDDTDGKISLEEFQGLARRFPNAIFPAYSLAAAGADVRDRFGTCRARRELSAACD
jgi:EF-hand domain pair